MRLPQSRPVWLDSGQPINVRFQIQGDRMIRVVLLTLSIVYTHNTFAQLTTDLPKAMKALHVNLPASCPLVEKPEATHGGNLPTTKCTASMFATATKIQAKVYRVVDGDTIHVYIGAQVYGLRMLGMDTPELHYMGRAQPVWGLQAKKTLASMVRGGDTVTLEFDKQKCDRYGRLLVHVFKNGRSLNFEQIRNGMAANYCIAPNLKYCGEYGDAYARARSQRLGIHSDKCSVTPYVWRKALEALPMNKPVKNRVTGYTFKAADYYKIPVEDRIFSQSTETPSDALTALLQ